MAAQDDTHTISVFEMLRNWTIVYLGNFIGALLFLFLFWSGTTHFGARDESAYEPLASVLCSVTTSKTVAYISTGGAAGWFAAVCNGALCNWMVTMGVMLSFSSRSTIGKVVAMYMPILIFICLGFEHSIVNLYLLPAGLAFGCDTYNFSDWWLWNQIPVTMGNMLGGIVLTSCVYVAIWKHKL